MVAKSPQWDGAFWSVCSSPVTSGWQVSLICTQACNSDVFSLWRAAADGHRWEWGVWRYSWYKNVSVLKTPVSSNTSPHQRSVCSRIKGDGKGHESDTAITHAIEFSFRLSPRRPFCFHWPAVPGLLLSLTGLCKCNPLFTWPSHASSWAELWLKHPGGSLKASCKMSCGETDLFWSGKQHTVRVKRAATTAPRSRTWCQVWAVNHRQGASDRKPGRKRWMFQFGVRCVLFDHMTIKPY